MHGAAIGDRALRPLCERMHRHGAVQLVVLVVHPGRNVLLGVRSIGGLRVRLHRRACERKGRGRGRPKREGLHKEMTCHAAYGIVVSVAGSTTGYLLRGVTETHELVEISVELSGKPFSECSLFMRVRRDESPGVDLRRHACAIPTV